MKCRNLGKTEIEISEVCMGCWAIVGDQTWGPQDESDAVEAIEASVDAGVTFFDTAPAYGDGRSEELLGRALKPHRDNVVIATKLSSGEMRRDDAIAACEASLRRLQTDHIDLYQIHWPDHAVPFDETAGALQTLLEQGKIRAVGVSNFGPVDLRDFLGACHAETNQVSYSLLFRAPEFEVLPLCIERGVGVLCYSPLAEAMLTGKFSCADDVPEGRARTRLFGKDRPQSRHSEEGAEPEAFAAVGRVRQAAERLGLPMAQVALAWLLHQNGVASVIAGARNARQARENAAAADIELPGEVIAELAAATDAVKQKLGPNLDLWQTDSRAR